MLCTYMHYSLGMLTDGCSIYTLNCSSLFLVLISLEIAVLTFFSPKARVSSVTL